MMDLGIGGKLHKWGTEGKQGSAPAGRRIGMRIAKLAIAVAIICLSSYYVAQKAIEGAEGISLSNLSPNYGLLAASLALTIVCTVLGGWEWSLLLHGLGVSIPVRKALRVHLLSIMPKYLPGFAWQIVGKAFLSKEAGVPTQAIAISMLGELAIIVFAGFGLALFLLPYSALPPEANQLPISIEPWLSLIAIVYLFTVPLLLRRSICSRLFGRIVGAKLGISYLRVLSVFALVTLTWALLGLAFYTLVTSIHPVPIAHLPSAIFSYTVALSLGLIVFLAPLGLGVREGVLTLLLSLWLPAPMAATIAIASRLVATAADVFAFLIATKL